MLVFRGVDSFFVAFHQRHSEALQFTVAFGVTESKPRHSTLRFTASRRIRKSMMNQEDRKTQVNGDMFESKKSQQDPLNGPLYLSI